MLRGSEALSLRARVIEWWCRVRAAAFVGPALPDERPPAVRWNPGRNGALSVVMVAGLALLVAGWWFVRGQPHRFPPIVPSSAAGAPTVATAGGAAPTAAVPQQSPSGALATYSAASASTPAGVPQIVVDVVGKVRRPGVYRLPSGSRVDDAVRAAGGALPGQDLARVNLARKLVDGEQVAIGVTGAVANMGAPVTGADAATGGLLDLNAATVAQLDSLPGVGPVLAQRIVDWRRQHGRFDSVDQLQSVSGVGDSKFADLKPLVVVQ